MPSTNSTAAATDRGSCTLRPALLRLAASGLRRHGAHLISHGCGVLTPHMIQVLARELHPTMFSLGSSRILWQDASPVSPDTVFYCNLPTRRFYSEAALPDAEVRRLTCHLIGQLRACGHPTSWPWNATSCMWLAPGATIRRKVEIMLES